MSIGFHLAMLLCMLSMIEWGEEGEGGDCKWCEACVWDIVKMSVEMKDMEIGQSLESVTLERELWGVEGSNPGELKKSISKLTMWVFFSFFCHNSTKRLFQDGKKPKKVLEFLIFCPTKYTKHFHLRFLLIHSLLALPPIASLKHYDTGSNNIILNPISRSIFFNKSSREVFTYNVSILFSIPPSSLSLSLPSSLPSRKLYCIKLLACSCTFHCCRCCCCLQWIY